ncbi:MAG: NUDIX domain-containing protein [Chloroflexota bacterium]|jgi:8-oxo-dGTP diphosphatase|nr:NUDIX domain-containing protein [Chloroflexota bacterium]MDH5244457.1 NUDIX domain-containing protein [Chloroflexota bacterium]
MTGDRVRVAAYALCRDEAGRVLLCHIAPSVGVGDVWTLPGGGLDFGESPSAAVVRELEEETGYVGRVERLLGVTDRLFNDHGDAGRLHAIRIVYAVRIEGGELRDESDGSTDTCRWLTLQEARRLRLGALARAELARLERTG